MTVRGNTNLTTYQEYILHWNLECLFHNFTVLLWSTLITQIEERYIKPAIVIIILDITVAIIITFYIALDEQWRLI